MDVLSLPLRTARTTIRAMTADDAQPLAAYRNDEEVARYQFWTMPYDVEHARHLIAGLAELPDGGSPAAGRAVQLAVEHGGVLAGDLYASVDDAGTTATIGYTFAPEAQRQGLASEATAALVDALFAAGIHRIAATVDPDNHPSGALLERLGFRYEGRAVQASLVRGAWVDDDCYALLAPERSAWLARPSTPAGDVRLVALDEDLAWQASKVVTHRYQERFVAPVARSYRDALFAGTIDPAFPATSGRQVQLQPWLRGVLADGQLVAFVMVSWPVAPDQEPYLWRLVVDRWHQRRTIGTRIVELVVAEVRAVGARSLLVSWQPGRGGPEPFYLRLGFVPTGDVDDGEVVARLRW